MGRHKYGIYNYEKKIMAMVTKNAEFFQGIAAKIRAQTEKGEDEVLAAMAVMGEHKEQVQELMQENQQ